MAYDDEILLYALYGSDRPSVVVDILSAIFRLGRLWLKTIWNEDAT